MTRKSGPLSKADKDFIKTNVDSMTVDGIADCLDRNPRSIINYIDKNRIGKKFEDSSKGSDKSQNDILIELKGKPFFKQLPQQFDEDEIKYFCDYWVLTVRDFGGNILSYEELELKEWLTFEILKSRALKQNKINIEKKESYKDQLELEFRYERDERDKERIAFLQAELNLIADEMKKYNKDFADLAHKADQIKKGLMKSREQRTKDMDLAEFNLAAWIKMLNKDYDKRKRVGEEMEIFRMAEEAKKKDLYEVREFADGVVDVPVLNSESVEQIKHKG